MKHTLIKSLMLLLVLFFTLQSVGCSVQLTEREEYAAECVKKLEDNMKVPDSLKLRSILVIEYKHVDASDKEKYAVIEYTAENSYGAALRSSAVFYKGFYLNDLESILDIGVNDIKWSVESPRTDSERNEYIYYGRKARAAAAYRAWSNGKLDENDYEEISVETIGKATKIDYNSK